MAAAHWQVRARQRAIPQQAIDLVLAYGDSVHDHQGAEIIYFSKRAKQRAERDGHVRGPGADKLADLYVVVAGGDLVTVGHRYKRLPRP